MYCISKKFQFDAAHQLHGLPDGHKCGRLHGHTYTVELVLEAEELDEHSFVVDYGELDDFRKLIDQICEHYFLNDVAENCRRTHDDPLALRIYDARGIRMNFPAQPSAENMARFFFEWAAGRWSQVAEVRVSETPKTWATYRPTSLPAFSPTDTIIGPGADDYGRDKLKSFDDTRLKERVEDFLRERGEEHGYGGTD